MGKINSIFNMWLQILFSQCIFEVKTPRQQQTFDLPALPTLQCIIFSSCFFQEHLPLGDPHQVKHITDH